jgi:hypothetical protein
MRKSRREKKLTTRLAAACDVSHDGGSKMRMLRRNEGGRGGALKSLRFVRRSWPVAVGSGLSQKQSSDHVVFSHGSRGNFLFWLVQRN